MGSWVLVVSFMLVLCGGVPYLGANVGLWRCWFCARFVLVFAGGGFRFGASTGVHSNIHGEVMGCVIFAGCFGVHPNPIRPFLSQTSCKHRLPPLTQRCMWQACSPLVGHPYCLAPFIQSNTTPPLKPLAHPGCRPRLSAAFDRHAALPLRQCRGGQRNVGQQGHGEVTDHASETSGPGS